MDPGKTGTLTLGHPALTDFVAEGIAEDETLALVAGVVWLTLSRLTNQGATGSSRAFDNFFLALVIMLVFTGVATEVGRYVFPVRLALAVYVLHLGTILSLFLTFPYSKFAHALYRTLAMAHERLTAQRRLP